jgi:hypothetical protein
MPTFKVTFHELLQDSQEYGSDDEHMISRVFFSLSVDGGNVGDFSADLKQVVGSDIQNNEIEVGPPWGYDGPFDHQGFSKAAREYFRNRVGSTGTGIHIVGGSHIRMLNNRVIEEAEYRF